MATNPRNFTWRHDGRNTDGSTFVAANFNGWEVEVNGTPRLSVPIAWNTAGNYTCPIADLNLANGTYVLRLRLLSKTGINSDWSAASVSFDIDNRIPNAPTTLTVV